MSPTPFSPSQSPASLNAADFWSNLTTDMKEMLKNVYLENVHWKPDFLILSKNKVGSRFVESLNVALSECENINHNSEVGMLAAMVMPHLILARTKMGNDRSVSKINARRLDLWINCEFELLFLEAKGVQDRLTRSNSKHETNEFKLFDKNMEIGKTSNALRCLTDESKGGVLPLIQKLGTKTVMDILGEKHPAPQTANLDYVVKDPLQIHYPINTLYMIALTHLQYVDRP